MHSTTFCISEGLVGCILTPILMLLRIVFPSKIKHPDVKIASAKCLSADPGYQYHARKSIPHT